MTIVDKPPVEQPQAPPQRERVTPRLVGGGVLILIGVLWLLERAAVIEIGVTAVLGLATMATGLALMVLSSRGSHGGLIVFGTLLALLTLITAAAPFEGFQGGIGERTIEVSSVDDIRTDYNLALGKLTIDLTQVEDFRPDTRLRASVGMGQLIVKVPSESTVSVDARVGAGELSVLGRYTDGLGISETHERLSESGETLTLELRIFAGRVEVTDE